MSERGTTGTTGTAGMLLTGGRSTRLGVDKASVDVGGTTLAERAVATLASTCRPCVEVGPGHTPWLAVVEDPPGAGPLAALAAGGAALRGLGHHGPAVVLAVDMPFVDADLVTTLAAHPSPDSVVPVANGRRQVLCARWSGEALAVAAVLVSEGRRAVRDLLDEVPV
ncbi:MAG TPA: NTP transferase domain-containing protein, partial [Acidimicrobiia bacterium]|nr:NTP transferase domain-containing protein [Acidimicrobiia bacterium]